MWKTAFRPDEAPLPIKDMMALLVILYKAMSYSAQMFGVGTLYLSAGFQTHHTRRTENQRCRSTNPTEGALTPSSPRFRLERQLTRWHATVLWVNAAPKLTKNPLSRIWKGFLAKANCASFITRCETRRETKWHLQSLINFNSCS